MFNTRPATESDRSFVHALLKSNMQSYFDAHLPEKWSDKKFNRGYDPLRITILEEKHEQVGFIDTEPRNAFLYVHNVQLLKGHGGQPRELQRILEWKAWEPHRFGIMRAKVFNNNNRARTLLTHLGWHTTNEIPQEHSVWMEKISFGPQYLQICL